MYIPIPPHTVSAGQAITYSLATSATFGPRVMGAGNGSASGNVTSGVMTMTGSSPFANSMWAGLWTDFADPGLPAGSTINAVYPVVAANGNLSTISSGLGEIYVGPGLDIYQFEPPNPPILGLFDESNTTFVGQYTTNSSLGNTVGTVTGNSIGARLFNTLTASGYVDVMNVVYVALAVYYTPGPFPTPRPFVSVNVGNTRALNN